MYILLPGLMVFVLSIVGEQRNNRAEFDKLIKAARPKKRKRSGDNEDGDLNKIH
jgi:hypothetical protein